MENKGLVSVIVPCYNMGKVLFRLIDSILEQTYKKIELITVDDGSTDNTREVILSYDRLLKNAGISLKYVYQENQGLGGAVNTGLKYFTGEYLCWPDADDFLAKDSIKIRKEFLDSHPDYNLVRSDAYLFDEHNLESPKGYITGKKRNRFRECGLFEDYILEKDIIFCPGCHMVRSSAFLNVNPQREIYPAKRGQNYQMLLPLLYECKFAFIDLPLYNYVIYKNSMSRGDDTFEKCIIRCDGIKEILFETLNRISMPIEKRREYYQMVQDKYLHIKCDLAFHYNLKNEFYLYFFLLKRRGVINMTEVLKRYIINIPILIKPVYFMKKAIHNVGY